MKTHIFTLFTAAATAACTTTPAPAPSAPAPPPPPAPAPEEPTSRSLGGSDDFGDIDFESLPPTASGTPSRRSIPVNRTNAPAKDYLPFIDVAIDEAAAMSNIGEMLQDHYTRIQIVTLKPDAYDVDAVSAGTRREKVETRNYKKESRNFLSRMLSSREVTRTLIAEFDVAKPDITATKALFSATFSSNRQEGEIWSTNESISVYATPYFKVGPNTTIEARFRLQLSDEKESAAGSNVMGALTQAANLIAPTSTLVTYFNAPLMTESSNFLDNAVGTLFGQSITEQSVSAFSVKSWIDRPILVVSADLPDAKNIKDTDGKGSVGQWAVYLDQPIPSIFTGEMKPDDFGIKMLPDYQSVTSGDILSFEVGEDLTVYDFLFSRLDLADRVTALNTSANPDVASLICNRIERGLAEVGFTSFDAAAGVWAASESDQFTRAARQALQNPETCDAMARWTDLSNL